MKTKIDKLYQSDVKALLNRMPLTLQDTLARMVLAEASDEIIEQVKNNMGRRVDYYHMDDIFEFMVLQPELYTIASYMVSAHKACAKSAEKLMKTL